MLVQWNLDFHFFSESRRLMSKKYFPSYENFSFSYAVIAEFFSPFILSFPLDKDKCRENPAWFSVVMGRGKLEEFSLVLINDLTDFPGEWHKARAKGKRKERNPEKTSQSPKWIEIERHNWKFSSSFALAFPKSISLLLLLFHFNGFFIFFASIVTQSLKTILKRWKKLLLW